jgi:D-amino-acid oxidase
MGKKIAVVGAGISGLSSTYKLVKAAHHVTVFAKQFSPNITSNKAAAFWFPFHVRNDKRGINWSNASYEFYKILSKDSSTGISMKKLVKMIRNEVTTEEPVWMEFIPQGACRIMKIDELKSGYGTGYEVDVPLIETQIFLPYLQNLLKEKGVSFIEKDVKSLDELTSDYDVVVNCSGLGSKELCDDETLIPVRGQVALLATKEDLK